MRWGRIVGLLAAALMGESAAADCLLLVDGTRVTGQVERLDADAVELKFCGSRRAYLRAAVQSIEFNAAAGNCTEDFPKPGEVAAGTKLLVKLSRPIDTVVDPIGQVIGGSLDQQVSLGDRLLIRKSAPVLLQLQQTGNEGQMRHSGEAPRPVLHVTAVRLDSGWANLDATADEGPVSVADAPGNPPQFFTVQKLQATSSRPDR